MRPVTAADRVFGSERRRSDPEVIRLIDRIRKLVAEQRRLEGRLESERREAHRSHPRGTVLDRARIRGPSQDARRKPLPRSTRLSDSLPSADR